MKSLGTYIGEGIIGDAAAGKINMGLPPDEVNRIVSSWLRVDSRNNWFNSFDVEGNKIIMHSNRRDGLLTTHINLGSLTLPDPLQKFDIVFDIPYMSSLFINLKGAVSGKDMDRINQMFEDVEFGKISLGSDVRKFEGFDLRVCAGASQTSFGPALGIVSIPDVKGRLIVSSADSDHMQIGPFYNDRCDLTVEFDSARVRSYVQNKSMVYADNDLHTRLTGLLDQKLKNKDTKDDIIRNNKLIDRLNQMTFPWSRRRGALDEISSAAPPPTLKIAATNAEYGDTIEISWTPDDYVYAISGRGSIGRQRETIYLTRE